MSKRPFNKVTSFSGRFVDLIRNKICNKLQQRENKSKPITVDKHTISLQSSVLKNIKKLKSSTKMHSKMNKINNFHINQVLALNPIFLKAKNKEVNFFSMLIEIQKQKQIKLIKA